MSAKKIFIGFVVLAVCVGTVFGFRSAKQSRRDQAVAASSAPLAKAIGPDSAPIRILDFSDFQCPACRAAVPILESFLEKYPGKVQLIFKHFPLRMHVWSPVVHQAAECGAEQGKFWELYKKIYENQPVWAALPDPMVAYAGYAQEVGLDMNQFQTCMVDTKVAERIAAEKKEGEALEVKSTPTFFINGKMFAGGVELQMGGEALIRSTLGLPPLPKADTPPASGNQVA